MSRVMVQAHKEWLEFRRDRLSLALAFLLPVLSLLLCGYGIRLELKNIPMVVQDFDKTSISKQYLDHLYATHIFASTSVSNFDTPYEAINKGIAKVGITIPAGFAKLFTSGHVSVLQVLVDGTDLTNAQIISNSIKTANLYFLTVLNPLHTRMRVVIPHLEIRFNPHLKESLFIVPGVFGVILWMYPSLLAAVSTSRENEQQTITRVYSSKLNAIEYLFGKAIVYFVVSILMAVLVITLGWLLFKLAPAGDPTPFIVALPIYIMSSVMFGLFVGSYANSQTVAVQATSTGGFFPCLLLSGFVYPIGNMPLAVSIFSIIVPAKYFIELSRDAFLRGAGWVSVWQDPIILLLFALVFFILAWFGLRRMMLKD